LCKSPGERAKVNRSGGRIRVSAHGNRADVVLTIGNTGRTIPPAKTSSKGFITIRRRGCFVTCISRFQQTGLKQPTASIVMKPFEDVFAGRNRAARFADSQHNAAALPCALTRIRPPERLYFARSPGDFAQ